jgi:mono/diheme cytochrome c family protein
MARHGAVMSNLVRAVVLLDRPTVRVLAGRIADEEVVAHSARSPHAPAPLSLPREFFVEQTKLAGAARDLAVAAADGADDHVLAERFAAVTGTCVGCHSSYLHGRPAPDGDDTTKTASEKKR